MASVGIAHQPRNLEDLADRQRALLLAHQTGDAVGAGLAVEMAAPVGWRRQKLSGQYPDIDHSQVLLADIELAVLAARARGEDVIVVLPELVDLADGVDVGERAPQHEGHDDEIVVRVHVVARPVRREDLVAEYLHDTQARNARLVVVEVEGRMARDRAVGMTGDVAGIETDRRQPGIAALAGAQDEAHAHAGWPSA